MQSSNKVMLTKENIFLLGWNIVLIYYVLIASSEFGLSYNSNYLRYFSFVAVESLWLIKVVKDKYKAASIILMFVAIVAVGIPALRMSREAVIMFITFVIASKDVDLERFVKNDLKVRLIIFLLLFVLSVLGVINNYSSVINGSLKYAFGWQHPNTCASNLILLLLEWLYLKWNRFTIKNWLVIAGCVVFLALYVSARTSLYAFAIVVVWYLFVRNKKESKDNKLIRFLYTIIYPMSATISYIVVYLYSSGTDIGYRLNQLMTSRLYFSSYYLSTYGFSIFGQDIRTVSTRQMELLGGGVHYSGLDMSYVNMPIQYGVLYTVLYLALYMYICNRLYKTSNYRALMLILFFGIVGIMSTATITFYRNYTMIFIWLVYSNGRKEKKIGRK